MIYYKQIGFYEAKVDTGSPVKLCACLPLYFIVLVLNKAVLLQSIIG